MGVKDDKQYLGGLRLFAVGFPMLYFLKMENCLLAGLGSFYQYVSVNISLFFICCLYSLPMSKPLVIFIVISYVLHSQRTVIVFHEHY